MSKSEFDASSYMKEARHYPVLSKEEEIELAKLVKAGDVGAQKKLIQHNLRFVIKVAHSYKTYCRSNRSITFDDIVQAGNEGLIRAAEKFDPERGYKFITYAVWWIKAYMMNVIRENFSLMKIGTTQAQRTLFNKQREIRALADMDVDNRDEARNALAQKVKVSVDDVLQMEQRLSEHHVYLHELVGNHDDGRTKYEEVIGSESDLDSRIQLNQVRNYIHHALQSNNLTERERSILFQRFFDGVTLQEIGSEQGVSRERIRQVEAQALRKLGAVLEDMGVSAHDIP